MDFLDFVAIKLPLSPRDTIDHKSMASFLAAAPASAASTLHDRLHLWAATMIERGMTPTSRRRYIEKLSTIYRQYLAGQTSPAATPPGPDPFDTLRHRLQALPQPPAPTPGATPRCQLAANFDNILLQAATRPHLALFLHLLLNVSTDLAGAALLTIDSYTPLFPQLHPLLDPTSMHHRRRYLFDLQQSRKRQPQLLRDTLQAITRDLSQLGIPLATPRDILTLWTAQAIHARLPLPTIVSLLPSIPPGYSHLSLVTPIPLTPAQIIDAKRHVADSLSPMGSRWYVMKTRRSLTPDTLRDTLTHLGTPLPLLNDINFYAPTHSVARRTGHRLRHVTLPLLPGILFFHTRPGHVATLDGIMRRHTLGWVYRTTGSPRADYSIIPTHSMGAFQRAVGTLTPDVSVTLTHRPPIGIGQTVRITGGVLAGYQGTVYSVKDNTPGDAPRQVYLHLNLNNYIKIEAHIDDIYLQPLT